MRWRRGLQAVVAALALIVAAPVEASVVQITFKTVDNWTIHGDYSAARGATRAVVLLHQRGGSAGDWKPLVARLNAAGIATLAIDQRGAGRSLGPQNGANAPWNTSNDIAGAVAWLGRKGFPPARVGLAGASYGANNALIYAAAHPGVPAVALLSPGANYNGLVTGPAAGRYPGAILVLTARDDPVTGGGPEAIAKAHTRGTVQLVTYGGSVHGTRLFAANAGSLRVLTEFFKRRL